MALAHTRLARSGTAPRYVIIRRPRLACAGTPLSNTARMGKKRRAALTPQRKSAGNEDGGSGCDDNAIAMSTECNARICTIKENMRGGEFSFPNHLTSPPAMKSAALLSSFIASALFFSRSLAVTLTDASQLTTTTYDYVIVGGVYFLTESTIQSLTRK